MPTQAPRPVPPDVRDPAPTDASATAHGASASDEMADALPGALSARYRLVRLIGRGVRICAGGGAHAAGAQVSAYPARPPEHRASARRAAAGRRRPLRRHLHRVRVSAGHVEAGHVAVVDQCAVQRRVQEQADQKVRLRPAVRPQVHALGTHLPPRPQAGQSAGDEYAQHGAAVHLRLWAGAGGVCGRTRGFCVLDRVRGDALVSRTRAAHVSAGAVQHRDRRVVCRVHSGGDVGGRQTDICRSRRSAPAGADRTVPGQARRRRHSTVSLGQGARVPLPAAQSSGRAAVRSSAARRTGRGRLAAAPVATRAGTGVRAVRGGRFHLRARAFRSGSDSRPVPVGDPAALPPRPVSGSRRRHAGRQRAVGVPHRRDGAGDELSGARRDRRCCRWQSARRHRRPGRSAAVRVSLPAAERAASVPRAGPGQRHRLLAQTVSEHAQGEDPGVGIACHRRQQRRRGDVGVGAVAVVEELAQFAQRPPQQHRTGATMKAGVGACVRAVAPKP
eukprot:ctg_254.g103